EASLGAAGTLPIVGLARSGIPADALEEGRNATITGIVKRAHPSATDQRFGIAPREAHDIRLGSAPQGETSTGLDGPDDPDDPGTIGDDPGTADDPGGPARRLDDVPIGTSLEGVPGLVGHRVRVAGALRVIDTPLLTLDDGSGRGLVRLLDFAPTFDPPLHLGEVVNVTGTVATRDVGGWEIVASAKGVLRASRLTVAGSSPSPSMQPDELPSASAATDAAGRGPETGAGGLLRPLLALVVGLGIAALLGLAGGLAVAGYRRRTRRRSAVEGPDGGPRTNERA
ncbi:MAG: OB-fold nucleic acid binding domain-containing protein, partial [Candidatus Limnocylindrales bacterium]